MQPDSLIRELQAMSKRELDRVLAAFDDEERATIIALVEPKPAAPAELPFSALAGLSPWMLKVIEPAAAGSADRMTPAARKALAGALNLCASASPSQKQSPAGEPGTFIGRLLRKRSRAAGR